PGDVGLLQPEALGDRYRALAFKQRGLDGGPVRAEAGGADRTGHGARIGALWKLLKTEQRSFNGVAASQGSGEAKDPPVEALKLLCALHGSEEAGQRRCGPCPCGGGGGHLVAKPQTARTPPPYASTGEQLSTATRETSRTPSSELQLRHHV